MELQIQWKLDIKRSDITNCFLRSQLNNFLCFVLFIDNCYNKISDITNKIPWSQGSCYTAFPLYNKVTNKITNYYKKCRAEHCKI